MRALNPKAIRRVSLKLCRPSRAAIAIIAFLTCLAFSNDAPAQHTHRAGNNQASRKASDAKTGILLLAHGGRQGWNAEVNKLASEIDKSTPVEVAFGMASKRTVQEALDRLVSRGVSEVIAVPLFISVGRGDPAVSSEGSQ